MRRPGVNNNASWRTWLVVSSKTRLSDTSRSYEPDDALIGPRCPLGARRSGSAAPGRSWSWETTLSGTLNVTRNVKSWTGRAAFRSPYWITSLPGRSSRVVCLCFVRVFLCIYFQEYYKNCSYNLLSYSGMASHSLRVSGILLEGTCKTEISEVLYFVRSIQELTAVYD